MSRKSFIVLGGVRVFPRQIIFIPLILLVLFVLFNVFLRMSSTTVAEWNIQIAQLHNIGTGKNKQACVQPDVDPTALPAELIPPIPEPLDCSSSSANDADWLKVFDDGSVGIHQDAANAINAQPGQSVECHVISVLRDGDDAVKYGPSIGTVTSAKKGVTLKVPDNVYTIFARCTAALPLTVGKASSSKQDRVYLVISRRQSVVDRVKMTSHVTKQPYNVVILMVDSLSRAAWYRYLKSTVDYFTQTLGGTIYEGYNIVGDGTPQNMFPVLMGLSEFEMPESRRFQKDAQTLDSLPWLFKSYGENGYVTLATEDMPMFSMYNYRFVGFENPPVDFYTRSYYLELAKNLPVWKTLGIVRDFCQGNTPKHKLPIQWLLQMFRVYINEPKFAFLTLAELTHDDNAKANWADRDLTELLKEFRTQGYLDNTFFLLMSDHGARYDNLRSTLQGKLEERLPFVGLIVPSAFKKEYPNAARVAADVNRQRLSSPYDLHATFVELLATVTGKDNVETFPPSVTPIPGRALSLFQEIPLSRTCEHAKIESHWCACVSWIDLPKDHKIAKAAADHVLAYINSLTAATKLCSQLSLGSLLSAEMLAPPDDLLRFRKTNDRDGYKADMSDTMVAAQVIYQITFTAQPSGAKYFATVTYWPRTAVFTFDGSKALSRLDRYGHQPWCVVESHPDLRPYCYCTEQKFPSDVQ